MNIETYGSLDISQVHELLNGWRAERRREGTRNQSSGERNACDVKKKLKVLKDSEKKLGSTEPSSGTYWKLSTSPGFSGMFPAGGGMCLGPSTYHMRNLLNSANLPSGEAPPRRNCRDTCAFVRWPRWASNASRENTCHLFSWNSL